MMFAGETGMRSRKESLWGMEIKVKYYQAILRNI